MEQVGENARSAAYLRGLCRSGWADGGVPEWLFWMLAGAA
jgi:hypothetical protein